MFKLIFITFISAFAIMGLQAIVFPPQSFADVMPLPPDAGAKPSTPSITEFPTADSKLLPLQLSIPAIALKSRIVGVGVNEKGEMDVPPGSTKDVGWYEYGVMPGEAGSAVMDAHVYAAFKKLSRLKKGSDIFVTTSDNRKLHFVVTKVKTFQLSEITPEDVFIKTNERHLNLITCAGKYIRSLSTYDHRLVVYATLAD